MSGRRAALVFALGAVLALQSGCATARRGATAPRAEVPDVPEFPRDPGDPGADRVPDVEEGLASYYGRAHHGKLTASGVRFDMNAMTAAHRRHPFGAVLRVTDVATGRSVDVKVNDRGPFARNRIIDLSYAAAEALGMIERGVARVRVERRD